MRPSVAATVVVPISFAYNLLHTHFGERERATRAENDSMPLRKRKKKAGQRQRFLQPRGVRRARLERILALPFCNSRYSANRVLLGIALATDGRERLLSSRVAKGWSFRHPCLPRLPINPQVHQADG